MIYNCVSNVARVLAPGAFHIFSPDTDLWIYYQRGMGSISIGSTLAVGKFRTRISFDF